MPPVCRAAVAVDVSTGVAYVLDAAGCQIFQSPTANSATAPWSRVRPAAGSDYNTSQAGILCAATGLGVGDGAVVITTSTAVYSSTTTNDGDVVWPPKMEWQLNESMTSNNMFISSSEVAIERGVALLAVDQAGGSDPAGIMMQIDFKSGKATTVVHDFGYNVFPVAYDSTDKVWYYSQRYNLYRAPAGDLLGPGRTKLLSGYPQIYTSVAVDHSAGLAFYLRVDSYFNASVHSAKLLDFSNDVELASMSSVSCLTAVPSEKTLLYAVNDQPNFQDVNDQGLGAMSYDGRTMNPHTVVRSVLWSPYSMNPVLQTKASIAAGAPLLCWSDGYVGQYCWDTQSAESITFENVDVKLAGVGTTSDGRSWLVRDSSEQGGAGLYTTPLVHGVYQPAAKQTLVVAATAQTLDELDSMTALAGQRAYFTETVDGSGNQSSIRSVNLDGSDPRTLVAGIENFWPSCVGADTAGTMLVFCDQGKKAVYMTPMPNTTLRDRSEFVKLGKQNLTSTVQVDEAGTFVYWNDWDFDAQTGSLHRAAVPPPGVSSKPEVIVAGVVGSELTAAPPFTILGSDVYFAQVSRLWHFNV